MPGKVLQQPLAVCLAVLSVQTKADQPDAERIFLVAVIDIFRLHTLLRQCHIVHCSGKLHEGLHMVSICRLTESVKGEFVAVKGDAGQWRIRFIPLSDKGDQFVDAAEFVLADLISKALVCGEVSAGCLADQRTAGMNHADKVRETLHRVVGNRKADACIHWESAVQFLFRFCIRFLVGILFRVSFSCSLWRSDRLAVVACIGKAVQHHLHDLGIAAVAEAEDRILAQREEVDLVGTARNACVSHIRPDQVCDLLCQCLTLALFDIVLDFHMITSVFITAPPPRALGCGVFVVTYYRLLLRNARL